MEQSDIELHEMLSCIKKGDCVQVREYDVYGTPLQLRKAEVLSTLYLPNSITHNFYVTVRYLEPGEKMYECIPLTRVESLCNDEIF